MTVNGQTPTMDLAERRRADHELSKQRREARRDYLRYCEDKADADRDYEKARATAFAEAKSQGLSDMAANYKAKQAGADFKHRRDIADSLARSCLQRIDETERDAVTVRDIHNSSERVDGLAA